MTVAAINITVHHQRLKMNSPVFATMTESKYVSKKLRNVIHGASNQQCHHAPQPL